MKKKVSIGFLGTTLDKGQSPQRWEKWRPTIDLHSFDDLVFDRLRKQHLFCKSERPIFSNILVSSFSFV